MSNPESKSHCDAREVATSFVLGHLYPDDRLQEEISGYYLEYFEDTLYPEGAVLAMQWRIEEDENITVAEPIHAYELLAHIMTEVGYNHKLLPDVGYYVFQAVKKATKKKAE